MKRRFSGTVSGSTPPGTAQVARRMPWWLWIILGSALFVRATGSTWFSWLEGIWPRGHAVLAHIRPGFDLASENNLGVWWSAGLLFLGSMLLLEVAREAPTEERRAWMLLGLPSLGLSIDEVASIHERLSQHWGWTPLIAIGIVSMALLGWALHTLARRFGRWRVVLLVVAGYLCYGSIAIQEAAEHGKLAGWDWWRSGRLEEGSELLGSLFILLAAVGERHRGRETRLRAVIPRPDRLPGLAAALVGALILHSLSAVFVVPRLPDWEWRGNPATWYPSATHALAACATFWRAQHSRGRRRGLWTAASVLFLIASIGAIFDEVLIFPGIDRLLPRWSYYGFFASYLFLVPPLLLLGLGGRLVRRPAWIVGAVALPLILYWLTGSWRVAIVTPGFLAWVFAMAFGVAEPADARATATPERPAHARSRGAFRHVLPADPPNE
jgi:hypothetical protein